MHYYNENWQVKDPEAPLNQCVCVCVHVGEINYDLDLIQKMWLQHKVNNCKVIFYFFL